jgi:hypothetical protein
VVRLGRSAAALRRVLARLELAKGDHDAAWDTPGALDGVESLIRHFRLLADQQRFVADKLPYYDVAFDVGLARDGPEGVLRAWSVAERAKSFYLCQLVANAEVSLFEGLDPARVGRLRALEDDLDTRERQQARGGSVEELEELSREKQELLDALMRENPRWWPARPASFDLIGELERLGSAWTPSLLLAGDNGDTTLHIFLRLPAESRGSFSDGPLPRSTVSAMQVTPCAGECLWAPASFRSTSPRSYSPTSSRLFSSIVGRFS